MLVFYFSFIGNCSDWGEFSECSKTCDAGLQERNRWCKEGTDQMFIDRETQVCNENPCYPPCK